MKVRVYGNGPTIGSNMTEDIDLDLTEEDIALMSPDDLDTFANGVAQDWFTNYYNYGYEIVPD